MPKNIDLNDFAEELENSIAGLSTELEKKIKLVCEKIRSDIQYDMANTPRDMSKQYFTNNKSIPHHPSMPGNAPAPDTGNLRQSIRYDIQKINDNEIEGCVGSTQKNPDYAVYTEYGTSKMAPRPWLSPAMKKNNEFIKNTIADAVRNYVKGGK